MLISVIKQHKLLCISTECIIFALAKQLSKAQKFSGLTVKPPSY